jgi:hypothetical protein
MQVFMQNRIGMPHTIPPELDKRRDSSERFLH